MRFHRYTVNENMVDRAMSKLKRFDFRKAKNFLKQEFDKFVDIVRENDLEREVVSLINKHFDTRYRNLKEIEKDKIRESDELNEDIKHWWELVKTEAFPTLAFYPALTVWLELDKLFDGKDINVTRVIVYALIWILLISGKYARGWKKWKEQNPEQYKQEREQGKGGII